MHIQAPDTQLQKLFRGSVSCSRTCWHGACTALRLSEEKNKVLHWRFQRAQWPPSFSELPSGSRTHVGAGNLARPGENGHCKRHEQEPALFFVLGFIIIISCNSVSIPSKSCNITKNVKGFKSLQLHCTLRWGSVCTSATTAGSGHHWRGSNCAFMHNISECCRLHLTYLKQQWSFSSTRLKSAFTVQFYI